MKITDIIESENRPFPAVNTATVRPNGRKTWRILDLIDIVPKKGDKGTLNYAMDKLAKIPEFQKSGIYVWSHPDFGIFYVGLNGSPVDPNGKKEKGVGQRWTAHIDKMLNRLRSEAGRTQAWTDLSKLIAQHSVSDVNKVKDDLADISVSYIPFEGSKEELHSREQRLINKLNPYANADRHRGANKDRPSSTNLL